MKKQRLILGSKMLVGINIGMQMEKAAPMQVTQKLDVSPVI